MQAAISRAALIGGVVLGAMAGCAADGGASQQQGSGNSGAGAGGSGGDPGGPGGGPSSGGGPATTGPGGEGGIEECASASSEAEAVTRPADIIIAVDTSGSMDAEADWTQNNLPGLVATLAGSGIDAHLVLIASGDMCVPTPLGSGACGCPGGDESLPAYRHVCQSVGSTNALQVILDTFAAWQPSLRPDATKTFAVVTDDDSDLSAASFKSQLEALDPTLVGFKFDAIAATAPPWQPGNCFLLSAAQGSVYQALVTQTGGVFGDLCDQSFDPVFQDMATAVIEGSQIACEYLIPEPDSGETIDYEKVNVQYSPGGSAPAEPIYFVPGGAADCGAAGGWYYDNPAAPTKILLCPASCDAVQASQEGAVEVIFGCETEIGPPR
jgi:hypothetical protein